MCCRLNKSWRLDQIKKFASSYPLARLVLVHVAACISVTRPSRALKHVIAVNDCSPAFYTREQHKIDV